MNELFEINKVKAEFLQNIGPEYSNVFSERQLEMSIYMLTDFCNALTSNSLVLARIEPEQIAPPQYQQPYQPPVPNMGVPPEYRQPQYQQPIQQPQYQQDPFQEMQQQQYQQPYIPPQQVQRQVQEMNAQLPRPNPQRGQGPGSHLDNVPELKKSSNISADVDMGGDKPKTFAEKIREMRAGTKKPNRINPEDDN